LDVPISASRLRVIDWIILEEKLEKKLDVWLGNFLSFGEVVLCQSIPVCPIPHIPYVNLFTP
jgi:hypothetical protein